MVTGVPGYSSSAPSWQQQQAFAQGVGGPGLSSSGGYDPSMAMASPYAYTTSSSSSSQQSSSSSGGGLGDILGGIFKGVVNSVKSIFTPQGLLFAGLGLAAMALTGGAAAPVLLAIGAGSMVFQGGKGVLDIVNGDSQDGWQEIGGALGTGLMMWGGNKLGDVFKPASDNPYTTSAGRVAQLDQTVPKADVLARQASAAAAKNASDIRNLEALQSNIEDSAYKLQPGDHELLGTADGAKQDAITQALNDKLATAQGKQSALEEAATNANNAADDAWSRIYGRKTTMPDGSTVGEDGLVAKANAAEAEIGRLNRAIKAAKDADPKDQAGIAELQAELNTQQGIFNDSISKLRPGLRDSFPAMRQAFTTETWNGTPQWQANLRANVPGVDTVWSWITDSNSRPSFSGFSLKDISVPKLADVRTGVSDFLASPTARQLGAAYMYAGLNPFKPLDNSTDPNGMANGLTPDQYAALQQYAAAQGGTIA